MLLTTRTVWPAYRRSFDRRFDRTFAQLANLAFGTGGVERPFGPSVSATWNDGSYVLTLDVPGVPEEALSVSVTGRTLVLDVNTDELTWNQRIRLPQTVDVESTSATYANGRLTVTVPVGARGAAAQGGDHRRRPGRCSWRPAPISPPARAPTPSDGAGSPAPQSPARDPAPEGRRRSRPVNPIRPRPTPASAAARRRASAAYGMTSRSTPTLHTITTEEPSRRRPSAVQGDRCLRPRRGTGGSAGAHRRHADAATAPVRGASAVAAPAPGG